LRAIEPDADFVPLSDTTMLSILQLKLSHLAGPRFRAQHLSLEVTVAIAAVFLLYVLMAVFFSRTSFLFGFWRSPRGRTWIRALLAGMVGAFLVYGGSRIIIHGDYYLPYSDHPGGLFSNVLTPAWNSFGKVFGPAALGGLTAIVGLAACHAAIQYARRGCAEPGRRSDPTSQETEQSANDRELEIDATSTGNVRVLEGSIAVASSHA
jgi:hypothetical protein